MRWFSEPGDWLTVGPGSAVPAEVWRADPPTGLRTERQQGMGGSPEARPGRVEWRAGDGATGGEELVWWFGGAKGISRAWMTEGDWNMVIRFWVLRS